MNTAILLYDGFTALDAIGPYEVLSRLPGSRVTFVAAETGEGDFEAGLGGSEADEEAARGDGRVLAGRRSDAARAPGRRPG